MGVKFNHNNKFKKKKKKKKNAKKSETIITTSTTQSQRVKKKGQSFRGNSPFQAKKTKTTTFKQQLNGEKSDAGYLYAFGRFMLFSYPVLGRM